MQGLIYLDILRNLMQGETFEPSQRDKLVYPVHDRVPIAVIAPEALWDDLGHDSAAESRHISRRAGHVCETCLRSGSGSGNIVISAVVNLR